ncbi:ribulose phosphate epimerase [Rhodobacter sp. TJ_12]|uniref:ribulose phosphate epimerase n=1 Tax=Rhodobacter sp. TJ_12 TaxID=2029399 RepID=UPI001CBE4701|nr:ribulose phosphate epimerase [Rhodobacter sp. TJ_12]MBZ4023483.1 ribulose phosphate epimerase [Rhodobacter sp. TJ_12]
MDSVERAALRARAKGIGVGIFAAPPLAIGTALEALDGAEVLHFDIMDGVWVPQFTAGPGFVSALRGQGFLDVHLMVAAPESQILPFAKAGADLITVHAEALNAAAALGAIRTASADLGRPILAGLGVMPGTALESLAPLLAQKPDVILVLALDPRDGAPADVPAAAERLAQLRALCAEVAADFTPVMAIDGGITADSIEAACTTGADLVVSGSAIFKAADPAAMLAQLEAARKAGKVAAEQTHD